jgi:hypothetical protein
VPPFILSKTSIVNGCDTMDDDLDLAVVIGCDKIDDISGLKGIDGSDKITNGVGCLEDIRQ